MFSRMTRGLAIVGRAIPVLIRDLCGIAGAALIAYGAWLIYAPAGYITAGVLVLSGVIALSAKAG